jgi:hypothetical protein
VFEVSVEATETSDPLFIVKSDWFD